jgi:hypothetical protein
MSLPKKLEQKIYKEDARQSVYSEAFSKMISTPQLST